MSEYYNAELKEWQGPTKPCLFNPKATVGDILFYGLSQSPNKVAQICVDDDSHMTRGEIKVKSIRFALYLEKELGLKRGDVVSFITLNHKLLAPALYGCIYNGIPYNCIITKPDQEYISYILGTLKSKLVVCEEFLKEFMRETLQKLNLDAKLITFKTLEEEIMEIEVKEEKSYNPSLLLLDTEKEILLYTNTSGTTGLSKIVPISHALAISQILGHSCPSEGDIFFSLTPMSWISATRHVLQNPISGGVRLITNHEYSDELQAKVVDKYKVTILMMPSNYLSGFLEYLKANRNSDLSSLKSAVYGGTLVFQDVVNEYEKFLPTHCKTTNSYGCSEAYVIANNSTQKREGAIGQIIANVRVKIIGESGERLGPNESGDIWVKTAFPVLPYANNTSNDYIDEEGWFAMGDIGYFDSDGFLFIQGRSKDILKYLGQNGRPAKTYSSIIENFIRSKTEFTEICVTSAPNPKVSYDIPAALIQRKKGSKLTGKEIQDLVKKELYPVHLDGGVYFVDELPRTAVGKIKLLEVQKIIFEMRNQD